MTGTKKVVRLSKAAREFNISLDSIVSFLTEKGYDLERKPNTKLDPNMYDLLTTEFQGEKKVKEVALKKGLEYVGRELISNDSDDVVPRKVVPNIPVEEELIIKDTAISYEHNQPANTSTPKPIIPEPEVVSEPEAVIPPEVVIEPEVVVEPEAASVPEVAPEPIITTKSPAEEEVTEIEKKVIEQVEVATEDINQDTLDSKKESDEKDEELPAIIKDVNVDNKVEIVKEEVDTSEPEVEVQPDVATDTKETSANQVKESVETEIKSEENIPKSDVVDEKSGINILGTIDLDGLNQKTRPSKKSKAEKKKERESKLTVTNKSKKAKPKSDKAEKLSEKKAVEPVAKKPKTKEEEPVTTHKKEKVISVPAVTKSNEINKEGTAETTDINFIKTNIPKLTGPVVTGEKIDLKQFEKKKWTKKPVASSRDNKVNQNKKKRKRIKPKPQTTDSVAKNKGAAGAKGGFKKRPFTKGKPRVVKAEPTEEEIQQKIKDTLARLAPSGKSKAAKHRKRKREVVSETMQQELQKQEDEKRIIKVTEFVTANEMATMMNVGVTDIITSCMQLGLFVSINQRLDAETIVLVAEEFGYQTSFVSVDDNESLEVNEEEDDPASLIDRAPIVTVMGHVDHGKTKLLDYIRHANVVSGEAGGITQHIGAYEVVTENGKKITFLDTPGHEAFTAMRARGAKVTDVAIIVIAADDSVMPQTKEAINHAQAAGVPIVFAINKMDKEGANAEKVKEQLANMNILVEDWGGKFQSQEISAITGMGIPELLEKVLLEAEMLELKANPNRVSKGTVIEATLDKGRGYVTTILVQNGTLKKGDILLAGPIFGKVKAMFNERNQTVVEAGPSTPVIVLGLVAAPQAGDIFNGMKDEKEAKILASKRQQLIREQGLRTQKHLTLDEIGRRIAIGEFKELNVIVKGDVDGSIEALTDALLKLSTDEVQVNVIHKAVGAISESDVMLASASDAIIIGFQVRPSVQARRLAEKEEIDIRLYSIIYQATEELETAIKGMLSPKIEEKITCNIEVRLTFKITKVGTIAGCYVLDGKVKRNTKVRVIRDGIVVYTGLLGSLKRFKDDVKEVATGYECGLNIENFNDIKVGDIVEGYEMIEVSR